MNFSTVCIISKSILILIFSSRNVLIPFFPLYIKYLNLSLIQMGVIRALQTWVALIFTLWWVKIGKKLSNNFVRRVSVTGCIFTTMTICVCLLFVPPYKSAKNVNHCEEHDTFELKQIYNLYIEKNSTAFIQNTEHFLHGKGNDYASATELVTQRNAVEKHISKQSAIQKIKSSKNVNRGKEDHSVHVFQNVSTYYNKPDSTESSMLDPAQSIVNDKTVLDGTNHHTKTSPNTSNILQYYGFLHRRVQHKNKNNLQNPMNQRRKADRASLFRDAPKTFGPTRRRLDNTYQQYSGINDEYAAANYERHFYPEKKIQPMLHTKTKERKKIFQTIPEHKVNHSLLTESDQLESTVPTNFKNPHDIGDISKSFSKTNTLLAKFNEVSSGLNSMKNNENNSLYHDVDIEAHSQRPTSSRSENFNYSANDLMYLFRETRNAAKSPRKYIREADSNIIEDTTNGNAIVNVSSRSFGTSEKNTFTIIEKHDFWSETFLFVVFLAIFYEVFFSQIAPWTEVFEHHHSDECKSYDHLLSSQIFLSKSYLWVISFPVLSAIAAIGPCPYQIAMHCFIAAVILLFAFLAALLFLSLHYSEIKHFRSRKLSKPPHLDKCLRQSVTLKIFTSTTNLLIGICTACYVEFLLWATEGLPGFPYNYEYLYCGYYSLNTLTYFIMAKYIQYKNNKNAINNDDSDSEEEESVHFSYEWFMKNKEIIYVEEQKSNMTIVAGTFLLSVTLLVVPFLVHAWNFLPIALLKGVADALLEVAVPERSWLTVIFGYGIGCFIGSIIASEVGVKILLFSASTVMFICSSIWLCYSIFLKSKSYTHISLEGGYHETSTLELLQENEDEEDWLERALQRDQFNQSKKLLQ